MPTQAIAGYTGKVYISDDAGANYYEIGELRDVTLHLKGAMLDASSHSSAGWEDTVPGLKSWSASFGNLFVSTDTAQDKLKAAILAGTKLKFRFDPEGTASGKERFSGDGYLESLDYAMPTNDLVAVSGSIKGAGALANANQ